ncbi:MAG: NAD+ synthase [Gammaproteobacteria bacterium]|nr:NAD+ synthase [Gammaproteobacteria bacterium]
MENKLRVAMAQVDLLVGDVAGNRAKVIKEALDARDRLKADAVVFPELTLTGYPPEDLLLRPAMALQIDAALAAIKSGVSGISIVLGYPHYENGRCYNAAAVIADGEVQHHYFKQSLPNHSVFDEKRYFKAGSSSSVIEINSVKVSLSICEDIWQPQALEQAKQAGTQLVININASPFHIGKQQQREAVLAQRVAESGLPIVYLNLVGGQDELIFDGGSFVINAKGVVTQRLPALVESLMVAEFEIEANGALVPQPAWVTPLPSDDAMIYNAIVLAVRDYIHKNGFNSVVIGLSGGIDSALTLVIAVDAIGAANVEAVTMPSRYTADMSIEDSFTECEALGIQCHQVAIEPMYQSFLTALQNQFLGDKADATEENIQARCRGVILMAISNKGDKIVLTTGNKSEMAVGYATLYGDMAGGFAPLKDVPKLLVYRLSNYRNTVSQVIPQRVIDRPPSAELALDQKDEDSLPPYDILDPVLEMIVEQDMGPGAIIKAGYESEMVHQVVAMVKRNEYKRRQAPPGVKITARAFGRDRRYPITSGFHEG